MTVWERAVRGGWLTEGLAPGARAFHTELSAGIGLLGKRQAEGYGS